RALADGLQALLQPGGCGAVPDAADVAAGKARAGRVVAAGELQADVDGTVERAFHAADRRFRLQGAEAGGGEIARDAAHAGAVGSVGREFVLDDRVGEAGDVGVALADAGGQARIQLDDAV